MLNVMKKYYKLITVVLVLLQYSPRAYCQDVGFSQFYAQPLLRNPALAGIFEGDYRFFAMYRNQWQSVTVPYKTYALNAEVKFPLNIPDKDITLTLGLQLLNDVAGTTQFSSTQACPALNTSIGVGGNSYVSIGIMPGLMQQRFDPTKVILNDQFVSGSNGDFTIRPYSNQTFKYSSLTFADLSAGVSFNSSLADNVDYYVGVGFFHLLKPHAGFMNGDTITLNKRLTFNAGLSSGVGDGDTLIFYGDYFGQYHGFFHYTGVGTFQAGVMLRHALGVPNQAGKFITAGVLYRWDDAVIPVVQLELSKFVIGVSYDINVSKLVVAAQARGGVELTLSYKDIFPSRNPYLRQVHCRVP